MEAGEEEDDAVPWHVPHTLRLVYVRQDVRVCFRDPATPSPPSTSGSGGSCTSAAGDPLGGAWWSQWTSRGLAAAAATSDHGVGDIDIGDGLLEGLVHQLTGCCRRADGDPAEFAVELTRLRERVAARLAARRADFTEDLVAALSRNPRHYGRDGRFQDAHGIPDMNAMVVAFVHDTARGALRRYGVEVIRALADDMSVNVLVLETDDDDDEGTTSSLTVTDCVSSVTARVFRSAMVTPTDGVARQRTLCLYHRKDSSSSAEGRRAPARGGRFYSVESVELPPPTQQAPLGAAADCVPPTASKVVWTMTTHPPHLAPPLFLMPDPSLLQDCGDGASPSSSSPPPDTTSEQRRPPLLPLPYAPFAPMMTATPTAPGRRALLLGVSPDASSTATSWTAFFASAPRQAEEWAVADSGRRCPCHLPPAPRCPNAKLRAKFSARRGEELRLATWNVGALDSAVLAPDWPPAALADKYGVVAGPADVARALREHDVHVAALQGLGLGDVALPGYVVFHHGHGRACEEGKEALSAVTGFAVREDLVGAVRGFYPSRHSPLVSRLDLKARPQ